MITTTSVLSSALPALSVALVCLSSCARHEPMQMWDIAAPVSTPGWVVFKPDARIPAAEVFTRYRAAFHLTPDSSMRKLSTEIDELGVQHDRYQQYFKNAKVEGAEFTVHAKDGIALKANGQVGGHTPVERRQGYFEAAGVTTVRIGGIRAGKGVTECPLFDLDRSSRLPLPLRTRADRARERRRTQVPCTAAPGRWASAC